MGSSPDATPTAKSDLVSASTTSTPLAGMIAREIADHGPLTFADFMSRALYDENLGYYRSGRTTVGRDGDFLTSPEIHPLFGAAVAATACDVWEALGEPSEFAIVDVGPGTGVLVGDAIAWAEAERPDFGRALRAILVEQSQPATERQQRRLTHLNDRVAWIPTIEDCPLLSGMIVANELLDAQPVHRLRWSEAGRDWEELYVGLDPTGAIIDIPGPVSDDSIRDPLAQTRPNDGQVVEVCAGVTELIAALARPLEKGLLLLFDYGYPRERLYASWRRTGTLMTFYRHTPGEEPYARIGEQDLTCHVDLDTARDAAIDAGLQSGPILSQAEWLMNASSMTPPPVASGGRGAELEGYLARRRAIETLSDPAGLGRIQVMAFWRGMDPLEHATPPSMARGAQTRGKDE